MYYIDLALDILVLSYFTGKSCGDTGGRSHALDVMSSIHVAYFVDDIINFDIE